MQIIITIPTQSSIWCFLDQLSFSNEEFIFAIYKCSNDLTPESDKLSWKHLKEIIKDLECFNKFINITNIYIKLGYWLLHFKMSTSIIIPKPNKTSYNTPKIFRLIVLLNILGKLIEKVISERLQFQALLKNFIHSCQLSRLKQWSMVNMGIVLTHLICAS